MSEQLPYRTPLAETGGFLAEAYEQCMDVAARLDYQTFLSADLERDFRQPAYDTIEANADLLAASLTTGYCSQTLSLLDTLATDMREFPDSQKQALGTLSKVILGHFDAYKQLYNRLTAGDPQRARLLHRHIVRAATANQAVMSIDTLEQVIPFCMQVPGHITAINPDKSSVKPFLTRAYPTGSVADRYARCFDMMLAALERYNTSDNAVDFLRYMVGRAYEKEYSSLPDQGVIRRQLNDTFGVNFAQLIPAWERACHRYYKGDYVRENLEVMTELHILNPKMCADLNTHYHTRNFARVPHELLVDMHKNRFTTGIRRVGFFYAEEDYTEDQNVVRGAFQDDSLILRQLFARIKKIDNTAVLAVYECQDAQDLVDGALHAEQIYGRPYSIGAVFAHGQTKSFTLSNFSRKTRAVSYPCQQITEAHFRGGLQPIITQFAQQFEPDVPFHLASCETAKGVGCLAEVAAVASGLQIEGLQDSLALSDIEPYVDKKGRLRLKFSYCTKEGQSVAVSQAIRTFGNTALQTF